MRSDGIQAFLALALLAGCSDAPSGQDGSEATTSADPTTGVDPTTGIDPTTGVTDDALCVPGYEGCPCIDDRCISGLECLSDFCVDVPAADPTTDETTVSGESSSTTTGADSSESTEDATSSGDEASSGGALPPCIPSDTHCADNEFSTCVDGQWELTTCDDQCASIGRASLGCADVAGCQCDVRWVQTSS